MAFRFFRRFRIAPGVTLNLSKRGGSLSFGPRGAKVTAGTSGVRRTLSLPGTGLWYTEHIGNKRGSRSRRSPAQSPPAPTVPPRDRLKLGFFKRLVTPQAEKDLVDGMSELAAGNSQQAYAHLAKASHLADAAFIAGMQAIQAGRLGDAEKHLLKARSKQAELGTCFRKYGLDIAISLPMERRCRHN